MRSPLAYRGRSRSSRVGCCMCQEDSQADAKIRVKPSHPVPLSSRRMDEPHLVRLFFSSPGFFLLPPPSFFLLPTRPLALTPFSALCMSECLCGGQVLPDTIMAGVNGSVPRRVLVCRVLGNGWGVICKKGEAKAYEGTSAAS